VCLDAQKTRARFKGVSKMSEILDHEIPDGWEKLQGTQASYFEKELANEVCSEHILYKVNAKVLARKTDRDDFLFFIEGLENPYCIVHLTWSKETKPDWPWTIQFESKSSFLETWQVRLYE
jgi:hypothetical protein